MSRTNCLLSVLCLSSALLALRPQVAAAQDVEYLSLTDTTLAVVRNMPVDDLKAELDAISTLLSGYEWSKRDADHAKKLIQIDIDGLKKEIDILKTKIELAKKEERMSDRDSLEAYKKTVETKKEYFEKAADLRERERRHAEALVAWTKRVRTYYEKAVQLMDERERGGREDDLLTLERELIGEQQAAADRLKDVASEMERVADRRKDLYKMRKELLKSDK